MFRVLSLALAISALLGLTGCADVEIEPAQSRVVASSDPDAVLVEAATILRRDFGRTQIDATSRTIKTQPVEFVTTRDSGSARDLYGASSRMRRFATVTIAKRDSTVTARVRVDVERKDAPRTSSIGQPANPINDSPGAETPINRDAATSEQQNTSWTRVRRDYAMERAILDELREVFARLSTSTEPETAPAANPEPSTKPDTR